jgi:cysteinyl-tRNA synthetase
VSPDELLAARQRARIGGDFAEADRIRWALWELGFEVRDGRDGHSRLQVVSAGSRRLGLVKAPPKVEQ